MFENRNPYVFCQTEEQFRTDENGQKRHTLTIFRSKLNTEGYEWTEKVRAIVEPVVAERTRLFCWILFLLSTTIGLLVSLPVTFREPEAAAGALIAGLTVGIGLAFCLTPKVTSWILQSRITQALYDINTILGPRRGLYEAIARCDHSSLAYDIRKYFGLEEKWLL